MRHIVLPTLVLTSLACVEAPPPEPLEPFEVAEASITELGEAMAVGRVTSEELVERYLARVEADDPNAAGYRVGAGTYGWDGAYGTHFWVDPGEESVGIVMIQTPVFQVSRDVENALMQAILD